MRKTNNKYLGEQRKSYALKKRRFSNIVSIEFSLPAPLQACHLLYLVRQLSLIGFWQEPDAAPQQFFLFQTQLLNYPDLLETPKSLILTYNFIIVIRQILSQVLASKKPVFTKWILTLY